MSVEEVSGLTRVRQTLVRQIEDDDYSQCGGDFYARGHIRNIAQAIGIDPVPLVAEFDAAHHHVSGPTAPKATQVFEPEAVRPERRGPNWSAAMAVALAVVCVWGLVSVFTKTPHHNQTTIADKKPPASAPATTPSAAPPVTTAPTQEPPDDTVAQADGVTVRVVVFRSSSWIRAVNKSGKQLFEDTLSKGDSQQITDRHLVRLVIGNAGAVKLIVNGKDIGPAGPDGRVVKLRFGPGDPE